MAMFLEQFARLSAVRATRSKYGFEPFTPAVSLEPNSATFFQRANVSVYKPEEAVGLQFDHLWLINMNDQVWP